MTADINRADPRRIVSDGCDAIAERYHDARPSATRRRWLALEAADG